ncbi:MAG: bifunctional diguanylate cyclase/phosphodiesterase [Actinobacteria bacterium]|nr:MAG: bifunctional diguanylate cyclase/phosphodiesterase [Actinomycetota bacterium]
MVLYACVIPAALVVAGAGVVWYPPAASGRGTAIRLVAAIAAVLLAQLARVRIRLGPALVSLGWGEAALVVVVFVVPLGWVPASVLVGVAISQVIFRIAGEVRTPLNMAYNAANFTLAAAAAAGVAGLVLPATRSLSNPRIAVGLILAAVVYTVVNLVLFAALVNFHVGTRFSEVIKRSLAGKVFLIVGNIAVGLLVVVTGNVDPRWLLVLPPVLWLLRQSYSNRLRADDERRGWQEFSRATEALNRLEERGVAEAGVRGAARLFPTATIEVRVLRPDALWSYRGGGESAVVSGPASSAAAGPLTETRPLQVGGAEVGELRVHFPEPVQLSPREQMQLSAFADALAAALHDAASHRELQALSARSLHAASHDGLTRLANRDALLAKGNGALRVLERETAVALLLLDVDHFREVNDTLGHAAGDQLLHTIADRMRGYARGDELVARLSGDEFGLLITSLDGPAAADEEAAGLTQALRRARELVDLVGMQVEVAGVPLAPECSVGVVVAPAGSVDMTELLRRGYIAMYRAKRGGGVIGWYDGAGDDGSTDRLALLAELREALSSGGQLVLAYQPALDLATGAPTGVEALVRWQHPRRGELLPDEFIAVLENSDLVGTFTRYVVDQALAVATEWAAHDVAVPVSINLSPRSLLDADLPEQLGELLAKHRVPAGRLVLEITETVVVPEHDAISAVLDGLQRLGVQLAVDDFGTGYSSLKFLTRVHVDEVKIDRSFVGRMVDSPEVTAIIKATVDLAGDLGVRVVAEGVETAEQKSALARLGCAAAQGYHFHPPLPAEKITGVLVNLARASGARVIPLRSEGAS